MDKQIPASTPAESFKHSDPENSNPAEGHPLMEKGDKQGLSFALTSKVALEGRYSYFGRTQSTWTPNNSTPQTINNYSVIELNRAFLTFSGHVGKEQLKYNLSIFGSTSVATVVPLGFMGYDFDEAFNARVGVWKSPGTREWSTSWAKSLGADRTMATTYFRPNWTPGVWAQGKYDSFDYTVFIGNSYGGSSANYVANRQGTGMLYAFSGTWEPLGVMGDGVSDLEGHDAPAIRIGATGVYQNAQDPHTTESNSNPDTTIFRLSNGTPLHQTGALGVGTTLYSGDVTLGTIDTAVKYQGLGLYAEFMFRNISNFGYTGPAPTVASLNDYGGIFQGSYFLIPGTLELFGRSSMVSGHYGSPWEAGGGLNWYPVPQLPTWNITAEGIFINHSPAQNLLTPYRAGESGAVGQMQMRVLY